MTKHILGLALAAIGITSPLGAYDSGLADLSSGPVTLAQAYQRAVTVSETLEISEAEIRQIEAGYRRGLGSALPDISWKMTQFWQDTTGVAMGTGNDATSTQLRKRRPESFFQLDQPLFHGLREFNAVRGYKAAARAAQQERQYAALLLLADVAEVFYAALELQQELDVFETQLKLTQERIEELSRRVRLGRSRESEILSARVELASLEAEREDTRQRWAAARETLWFLTRITPEPSLMDDRSPPALPDFAQSLGQAGQRPDLLAAAERQRQQERMVTYAKGNFWPGLDFTGRYYTERVGFNKEVNWDMQLDLTVPIFTGLQTLADVREARATLLIAQLERARQEREVKQEIRTAHNNLRYGLSQTAFYAKAVELAERNYKIQQEEYRLGLINNLQVFDVLNTLQDLRLRKLRADAGTRLNDIRLRVAMGLGL